MALGDLHVFTGEEYVDTELAPLLNENFNSLKEYVDDASRWQVMPVQFKGTNAKFLIHETTLGTGTTQVLPLVVLDNTDIAKFSACSLKVVMSTKNGSTAAVNCDISLQKVHNSNECNVNFNTTNSDDAKAEPCTFTYNNIKYAGLKLTTGNADTLWVSGYTTEEWIAPVVDTSVTNLVTLGSDMNVIPTLFKSLQTDKSPVNDYDVVNKKSLNDLTNIKTYSKLSQIGLSGGVLDNSPYAIGNALPANSMLIVGIGGEGNTYNYPSQTGNLTVVRAHTNHVFYEITTASGNGYAVNYVLQFSIDTASEDTNYVWKRVLTDVDTGYWQPNETVTRDTVRKLVGKQYAGCFLVCKVAGTTGSTQPSPDPADGAGIGGGSGSITFYSSLEEIGITPGQETFESIHNALPMNSVLEYYAYPNSNFNDDMYPVTSYYGVLQAVKLDSTKTVFSFYAHNVVSGNEFSELYLSAHDYSLSDSRTSVWKKVALDSDLTNLSNSVNTSLKNYLPLIGGLMSGTIKTSKTTGTYRNGNLGESIINSTAANGSYTVLATMNSTNGKFTLACYQGKMLLQYTSNATIATEENRVDKSITLMDESGSTSLSTWTISKGTNGWARESSTGFTIQWGRTSNIDINATSTISFPRTFSTVYSVTLGCQPGDDNKTAGRILVINRDNVTNSSFQVTNNGWAGTYVGARTHWIAIGIS